MPTRATTQLDPRGPRFSAAVTATVVTAALLTTGPLSLALTAVQTLVFAAGALLGPQRQPYGWVYRQWVRPRLAPPEHTEDANPPRFAQAVGLAFGVTALLGFALGGPAVTFVALGSALVAAILNAAFGLCLGCELYLVGQRTLDRFGIGGHRQDPAS